MTARNQLFSYIFHFHDMNIKFEELKKRKSMDYFFLMIKQNRNTSRKWKTEFLY